MKFVDLDQVIAQRAKQPIAQLIAIKGWPYFRKLEQTVAQHVSQASNTLIATGGGTLMSRQSYQALRHHYIILLTTPLRVILQRLKRHPTALVLPKAPHILWPERRKKYYQVADRVIKL